MYNIIYYLRAKLINFHENTDKEGAKMNILIIFNSIAFSPMIISVSRDMRCRFLCVSSLFRRGLQGIARTC